MKGRYGTSMGIVRLGSKRKKLPEHERIARDVAYQRRRVARRNKGAPEGRELPEEIPGAPAGPASQDSSPD